MAVHTSYELRSLMPAPSHFQQTRGERRLCPGGGDAPCIAAGGTPYPGGLSDSALSRSA
ncbi:MAG: hypothetical protein HOZ81_02385 [Streptomyces sp.]|nr:hypothetical protein [Streptomyces sp.]